MQHEIVSREEWLAARMALLDAEKKLAEARTAVVEQRRTLPWTRSRRPTHSTRQPAGRRLADLFEGRGRLIVYHFMFAPDWQDGCPGCSRLADHFDGMARASGATTTRPSSPSRARRSPRSRPIAGARDGASNGCRRSPATSTTTTRSRSRPRRSGSEAVYGFERCKIDAWTCPAPACSPATRRARSFTPTRPISMAATCRSASTIPRCWDRRVSGPAGPARLSDTGRQSLQGLLEWADHAVVAASKPAR